jgi:hypothetical protein
MNLNEHETHVEEVSRIMRYTSLRELRIARASCRRVCNFRAFLTNNSAANGYATHFGLVYGKESFAIDRETSLHGRLIKVDKYSGNAGFDSHRYFGCASFLSTLIHTTTPPFHGGKDSRRGSSSTSTVRCSIDRIVRAGYKCRNYK